MGRAGKIIIGVIILAIIVGGGYALFHKSNKSNPNNNSSSNNSSGSLYGNSSSNGGNGSSNNSSGAVIQTKTSSGNQYLATASGLPLYTYKLDSSGVSNCTGSCLSNWPAYTASSSSASLPTNVSTIVRSDNHQLQYAYKGLPLYTFTGDSANSAPTGNGLENFVLATP